ncbi:NAD/NADP octopine/nopaline dehydrogenase family protein [Arthrobacter sp. AK01]|uniref:NAD/NADP octopine/nopaline dehydrogenase family protein n=1 Tax=Micrococcaceae TaxID=1268 RepID=UPI001E57A28B|nr:MULTISPECIES: NAD/NADP octopine/nopaline dehydrogenase family protein [Micrococcaceae]MCD4852022.1 NAD/NADP octopine/nopaline dehydrogenase family protein [Arthrobacter sp. AK01]
MTIAVLGAGGGGLSAAVELTAAGHDVVLWNRNPDRLAPHVDQHVRYRGVFGEGAAKISAMTSDLHAAIDGAAAVAVCLPSVVHARLFQELATEKCSVPIILNPGHTGGALHLRAVFASAGVSVPPVAEFSTLTYVARVDTTGAVNISGRANQVRVAALPGGADAVLKAKSLFPGCAEVSDVLASSLSNVNLVLHPPGAVLGASWVEATGGDFTFYVEGMTAGVGRVLNQLDMERLEVARAFGHELPPLSTEMAAIGTVDETAAQAGNTVEAIRGGAANAAIAAPDSFSHRYYQEDLAFGLLPFVELARIAQTPVPVAEALLKLGATAVGGDLLAAGLDAGRLGLKGMTRDGLIESVRV